MNAPATTLPSNKKVSRTAVVWLAALAVYWVTLIVGTHSPTRDVPSGVWEYDKLLHAGAYAVLTMLVLIAWRRVGGSPGMLARGFAGLVVLGYGAIDELTQPLFGRQCELLDWLADAAGVALAIALDVWRHGWRRS